MKWKRGSFRIALNPRATHEPGDNGTRDGLLCAPWAINKQWGGFVLTALATGLQAGSYNRMTQAKQVAEKLAGLPIDWTVTSPLHDVPPDVRTLAQTILRG